MGLRCLLGHDFTEPSTEREREERGDEVITTIREVKECRRCGETQVVSENTEVTSMGGAAGGSWQAGANATAGDGSSGGGAAGGAGTVVDGAEAGGESGSGTAADATGEGGDATEPASASADDGFDHPRGDPGDADPSVEDDAEIIRDGPANTASQESGDQSVSQPSGQSAEPAAEDGSPAERGHGEWPDSERNHHGTAAGGESDGSSRGWPDPDARPDAASEAGGGSHDTEDPAASEARSGVASDADRGTADGTTTTAGEEDAEFIDADDADSSTAWPEQAGEDEGFDAEVSDGRPDENVTVDGNLTPRVNPNAEVDDDAEFIEASSNASESSERRSPGVGADVESNGRGESNTGTDPSESSGPSGGRKSGGPAGQSSGSSTSPPPERAKNGSSGASSERSTATHDVELRTTVDDRTMEYLCTECGKREPVGASSMRAGDICPECKRGYIEEREL